jgi:hypothetical protein
MQSEVIIAIIAFFGTLAGTFGGILTANKLTNHRLLELEKRVDKHNSVIERMCVAEERIRAADQRILILEEKGK